MNKKFYINSNTGDWVEEYNDTFKLHIISRYIMDIYYAGDIHTISKIQFNALKGFMPIKEKKLETRMRSYCVHRYNNIGRIKVPGIGEIRNETLKNLGI